MENKVETIIVFRVQGLGRLGLEGLRYLVSKQVNNPYNPSKNVG